MVKISVIVPVYRAEEYLDRCVQSILNQSFHNLELILVDDGSPDRCPALCDTFAQTDNRVRVIHQENAGVAAARNAGLTAAKGEYVAFVDSDDYIDVEMYEAMIEIARKYNCDLVMCDCIKEFGKYVEMYSHDIREGYYDREQLEQEYFPHLLIMSNVEYPPTISNWLCLYRHNQNNKFPLRYEAGIRYSEDWLFGAQMVYQANSFYYMKGKAYYHYNCTNQQSATHTFVPDKWNDYVKLHQRIKEEFENCPKFDFSEQIDKVLLFFVYNAVGDLIGNRERQKKQNLKQIKKILNESIVREMFKRLRIRELPVSKKLKLLTWCYKYQIALGFLYDYQGRKN